MLADPRSNALLTNFFGQWLTVRNVASVRPDRYLFPEFDENLRAAFERETALFLESQLRDDRSVVELLTADYTFLNERLARITAFPTSTALTSGASRIPTIGGPGCSGTAAS